MSLMMVGQEVEHSSLVFGKCLNIFLKEYENKLGDVPVVTTTTTTDHTSHHM